MMDYVARFIELARFADDYVADECLKHTGYTRVCLTFLALFYI